MVILTVPFTCLLKLRKLKIDDSIYLPLPNTLFIIMLPFHAVLSMQLVIHYQMNPQKITVLNLFPELFLYLSIYSFLLRNLVSLWSILNLLSHFEALSQASVRSSDHVSQSILIG
jgi:hypothetical protein